MILCSQVTRNVINVKFHIGQYKEIIASLRNEVAELKEKLRQAESRGFYPLFLFCYLQSTRFFV
jgi:hypothetical protein